MRLMHLVDSLEFGGLERVVTDLATAQRQAGHQVSVFSLMSTEGFASQLEAVGVDVLRGYKSGTADMGLLLRLRGALRKQRVEVVHAHSFVPNYYAAAARFAWFGGPVQVGTCHDMGTRLSNDKLRRMYRWSVRRTALVTMVGAQVHERFVAAGHVRADQALTVRNGIPVARFAGGAAARTAARAALGLAPSGLVIGCVGRHVALKNHRLMIRAMPALRRAAPGVTLVLLGDGELRATLEAQARDEGVADCVLFPGQRPDVADLLPAFDVFALPSRTEGLSIALLEACASGLAIVASEVGGNPEIISAERTGLLVPVDDEGALQAALQRLLREPDLRARLGSAARDWVTEHASIDAMRRSYDEVYRRALGGSGTA